MFRFMLALVALLAAGCSTIDTRPPEEIVEERALAQAQALVDQDFETALSYTTPTYQDSPRASRYQADHSNSAYWKRVEVRWVKCGESPDSERCEVRVWIFGNIPAAGRFVSDRGDTVPSSWNSVWIKTDGDWFQYLD